jgi:hypothetical protein
MRRHIEFQGYVDTRALSSLVQVVSTIGTERCKWEWPPEFFTFPQCLRNENQFKFDLVENMASDVVLPKWAKTPEVYANVSRIALDYCQIGPWIDLFFGIARLNFDDTFKYFPPESYPEMELTTSDDKNVLQNKAKYVGSMPGQVIRARHSGRGTPTFVSAPEQINAGSRIIAIRKNVVLCEGAIVYDLGHRSELRIRGVDRLWGVSRAHGVCVVGGNGGMAIVDGSKSWPLPSQVRRPACADVIGGMYLLVGGADCVVSIIDLNTRVRLAFKCHHSFPIVAIGGNADAGLIVSVDDRANVVFETMLDHRFINLIVIEMETTRPIVRVFKSGLVAITKGRSVGIYDCRGRVMRELLFEGRVRAIEKYYDIGARELLLVGGTEFVDVFDLTTLDLLALAGRRHSFDVGEEEVIMAPIKRARAFFVAGNGTTARRVDFGGLITTTFGE